MKKQQPNQRFRRRRCFRQFRSARRNARSGRIVPRIHGGTDENGYDARHSDSACGSAWLENENLFICFDKSKRSNYNYANTPEVKAKLRRAAGESIAPHGVELVLKDGSVVAKKDVPTELFGVEITEV